MSGKTSVKVTIHAEYLKELDEAAHLVSSTPYARRLYYHPEYRFDKKENPNAGAGWFDDWAEGGANQNFAEETFAAIFKREAGL